MSRILSALRFFAVVRDRNALGARTRPRLGRRQASPKSRHLVSGVVEAILDRLESVGQRAKALLQPLELGGRRDVERSHRGALRVGGALAGAEGSGQRLVEKRVLEQGLGEIAERLLAAGAEPTADRFLAQGRTSFILALGHAISRPA